MRAPGVPGAWRPDLNELTSRKDGDGDVTTYAYNDDGRRTSVTDPLGNVATYAYDADGQLASVTAPDGGVTRPATPTTGRGT
jgi:YD repeat-containing protein